MEFLKRYWFLLLIILGIFIIQTFLYSNTFSGNGFNLLFWENFDTKDWKAKEDDGLEGKWGAFGDYIGGILNPILGFITIILLLISHYKDSERDNEYRKQREIDLFLSRVEQLKQTHNDHINNLNLIVIDKSNENAKYEFVQQGRFLFTIVLNSISIIKEYFLKDKNFKNFNDAQLIEISIALLLNGNSQHFRKFFQSKYPTISYPEITVPILRKIDVRLKQLVNFEMLIGLRTQLSPYFRNLFHIIDTIDTNEIIHSQLKYELIKDIRVTMSSQEQTLLLLNASTNIGKKWNEKELIIKYRLCRNIGSHKVFADVDLEKYVYSLIDNSSIKDKVKYKNDFFE